MNQKAGILLHYPEIRSAWSFLESRKWDPSIGRSGVVVVVALSLAMNSISWFSLVRYFRESTTTLSYRSV